jgi:hypothetical protein
MSVVVHAKAEKKNSPVLEICRAATGAA